MDAKRICPYCMQELDTPEPVCPHCGRSLTGRNPSGSLPVGTVLAGRYTVGEIQSIDGEGILYRGVENKGRFRVTVKEYMPLTLAAERGRDCHLRPKPGSEVLFKTTRMDFADLYHAIQRITPAPWSLPPPVPCCSPCLRAWRPCTRWGWCTGASVRPTSGCWTMAGPG